MLDNKKKNVWVITVAQNTGRVLVAKRSSNVKNSGEYNFIGGKINKNEYPIKAAARELREETGFIAKIGELYNIKYLNNKNYSIHGYVYLIPEETKPTLNDESDSYKYVNFKELKNLDLHKPTKILVDNGIKKSINIILNYHDFLKKSCIMEDNILHVASRFKEKANIISYSEKKLKNGSMILLYMNVGDKNVGNIGYVKHNSKLCDLYVKPEYRNIGYSHMLINELIDRYKPQQLLVSSKGDNGLSNDNLVNLYKKHGFKIDYMTPEKRIVMVRD